MYHYVSRDHCLECRCTFSEADAAQPAREIPPGSFFVGLTSIHWREAWKYGERAYRYCQHDVGHALATLRLAAAVLGWSARLVESLADADLARMLGVDRADDFARMDPSDCEQPDAMLVIEPAAISGDTSPEVGSMTESALAFVREAVGRGGWSGQANPLSPSHVDWPIIEAAAEAAWKPVTELEQSPAWHELPRVMSSSSVLASPLIRQRRSCLALDGQTPISAQTFYRMLDHLLPRPRIAPWDMLPWEPLVHLAVFVHRIEGLPTGLYLFERAAAVHSRLQEAVTTKAAWQPVPGCPEHLRLFFLVPGDCRHMAGVISCHQEIAADGAFSLGMIADFGDTLRQQGPWWYRSRSYTAS